MEIKNESPPKVVKIIKKEKKLLKGKLLIMTVI